MYKIDLDTVLTKATTTHTDVFFRGLNKCSKNTMKNESISHNYLYIL